MSGRARMMDRPLALVCSEGGIWTAVSHADGARGLSASFVVFTRVPTSGERSVVMEALGQGDRESRTWLLTDLVASEVLRRKMRGVVAEPERGGKGPCLDPDKMHGAGDGFGGSDF